MLWLHSPQSLPSILIFLHHLHYHLLHVLTQRSGFQHLHFLALSQEFLLEVEGRTEIKLSKLLAAMTVMENGIRMGQVDMEAIYQGYKLAFPENAQEPDEWMLGEDEYAEW